GEPIQFVSVSAGFRYTCGLAEDGKAYCWGSNSYAALGTDAGGSTREPVVVSGGLAFASISGGVGDYNWESENFGDPEGPHTCAVTADGDAYCWGANTYGQLGHGEFWGADSPIPVEGDLTFSMLSAGAWHTCGLTADGAAYCWGWATTLDGFDSPSPVAVPGGLTFSTITAGSAWSGPGTCALTATGTAYCWATNGEPTAVEGNLSFGTLSIGFDHVCGVTTDGAAYCWGNNTYGQLGDGSTMSASDAVAVAGGLTFTSVSAGTEFSCGVVFDGAAYCWGSNADGRLGNGSSDAQVETPVAVAGGLAFTTVDAGEDHACGMGVDGIAWCWGGNAYGELGDGSTASSNVPVRVARQP
ncbi:MAG: hypothetical protein KY476_27310, partial [Planctomycetes bacterium]|nr:hypothetical protein [Planctomycetota bacterium]